MGSRVALAATGTFAGLLLLASLLFPLFLVPDEAFHADLVWLAQHPSRWVETGWPTVGERSLGPEITSARRTWQTRTRGRTLEAAPPPRKERARLDELADGPADRRLNRMAQHPPLYYLVTAAVAAPLEAVSQPPVGFDQEIWLYRIASLLLLVPLPWLAYDVSRRIHPSESSAATSAILMLGIPGLTLRNGPMINNDDLLVILSSVTIVLAVRIVQGSTRIRTAFFVGAVAGLAALTKAFGVLLAPTIVVAYLVAASRGDVSHRGRWLFARIAAAGVTMVLAGGWWWVRNLIVIGTVRPHFVADASTPVKLEGGWDQLLVEALESNWITFWGGDFVFNSTLHLVPIVMVLGAMFVGVLAAVVSRDRRDQWALLVGLSVVVVLMGALYVRLGVVFERHGILGAVQGRYLYGGIVGFVVATGIGWAALAGKLERWLPSLVLAAVVVVNVLGIRSILRYWGEPGDDLQARWEIIRAWVPVDPAMVLVLVALTCVGVAAMAVQVATLASRSGAQAADSTAGPTSPS